MDYIKGKYKRTIYSTENGYVVGLFKVNETNIDDNYINKTITFTGYFHELDIDGDYSFDGEFTSHAKYGEQFNVTGYEKLLPKEKNGIIAFLSSDIFKGIGEKKAEKIVNTLGDKTLQIILDNKDSLLMVQGVTTKNRDLIYDNLLSYQASYEIIVNLNKIGFSTKDALIVYKRYKDKTLSIIDENIYRLIEDIDSIGFKKIDVIAMNINVKKDDRRRIKASIIYVIDEVCNTYGYTYLFKEELFNYTNRCLGIYIDYYEFDCCLNELINDKKVVLKDDGYYNKEMYDAEVNIVNRISYLNNKEDNKLIKKNTENMLKTSIEDMEKFFNIVYNEEQLKAIRLSFLKSFLIITGGPGTGKTTIIKGIVALLNKMYNFSYNESCNKIALLAPTGRASKRLTEATLMPASTIHRFLKWNKDNNKFGVNEHNPSEVSFIIVDEASMIDTFLFTSLLKGLKLDTKIILVGDYNQLPSVGPGQVLKDLIESDLLEVINLKYLYRQSEDSKIKELAYKINSESIDENLFINSIDYEFIESNENDLRKMLIDISLEYKKYDYKDFQIMAPIYKTYNGIDNLNNVIQNIFNPKDNKKNEMKIGDTLFREGDKVLQLVNMPDENIFNGDIGIIVSINATKKEVYIDFDSNKVKFTPNSFNNFKLGYVISIHKSQGSETKVVIIPLLMEYRKMLYKKLLYTAVTRAKEKLYIIGEKNAFVMSINNNSEDIRRTTVKKMLHEKYNVIEITHNS